MDKRRFHREDGYQKGLYEAKITGGKVRKEYIDNYMKTETQNLPSIYSVEFIKGWHEGFADGVSDLLSKLVMKEDYWGNHIYEVC